MPRTSSTQNSLHVYKLLYTLILCCACLSSSATTHHVGTGKPYPSLTQAIAVTKPGDTVMIHHGTYPGNVTITKLQGTAAKPIYILCAPSATVVFTGGAVALHLTEVAYLFLKGFIFQQQTGNGLNIDDGGSYHTPSHHVVIDACTFRDIKATGNNDLLKLSGVDFFEIKNCVFLNGSPGGSGIDMVGCHEGLIGNNRFENQGSNSIQCKGGTNNIRIAFNFFKNGGQRTLNLGGSTGLEFFRPADANYEAADLTVYSNLFIGSDAPIAYVGCIRTKVVNNTFYCPQKWVIRILQETTDTSRFYPCGNNAFINNIVYRDSRVGSDCNIGAHTNPQSFEFADNLWYHAQNPAWRGPVLPVKEVNAIINKDPLFTNADGGDFTLQPASPAVGKGYRFGVRR